MDLVWAHDAISPSSRVCTSLFQKKMLTNTWQGTKQKQLESPHFHAFPSNHSSLSVAQMRCFVISSLLFYSEIDLVWAHDATTQVHFFSCSYFKQQWQQQLTRVNDKKIAHPSSLRFLGLIIPSSVISASLELRHLSETILLMLSLTGTWQKHRGFVRQLPAARIFMH